MPRADKQRQHRAVIRSRSTQDNSHSAGVDRIQRGDPKNRGVTYPFFGSAVAKLMGPGQSLMPPYVSIKPGNGGFVYSVAWNHDGTRLATAGADGIIKVWDPSDGTEVLTIPGHAGNIWSVDWSQDGSSLASAGADRRVRIWTSHATTPR